MPEPIFSNNIIVWIFVKSRSVGPSTKQIKLVSPNVLHTLSRLIFTKIVYTRFWNQSTNKSRQNNHFKSVITSQITVFTKNELSTIIRLVFDEESKYRKISIVIDDQTSNILS